MMYSDEVGAALEAMVMSSVSVIGLVIAVSHTRRCSVVSLF